MNINIPQVRLCNSPVVGVCTAQNGRENLYTNTMKTVSFGYADAPTPPVELRTRLATNAEKSKYLELFESLDKQEKKSLEYLLKTGRLLDSNSNDKSTVLDNLYMIKTTPRAQGLDAKNLLKETIEALSNPFLITQRFGNIPSIMMDSVIEEGKQNAINTSSLSGQELNPTSIDVKQSNTCVAASIEFNLAQRMPAEFSRLAEGLTSPDLSAQKTIKLSSLTDKTLDSVWLLDSFKIPYVMDNFDTARVTLAPDKNAIIRAHIQTVDKDPLERSSLDVMMQSTFMNVGSQQSYNSLTDKRKGEFSEHENGLIEFEKTFTESIVEDVNKTSITYQNIDENGKLVGYEKDSDTVKRHILNSLNMGENVIIGYVEIDKDRNITMAHEITIIGANTDKNGKLTFICNDTDDDKAMQVEYLADELVPKINHAGLPQKVVAKDAIYADSWVASLNFYRELKNQKK